MTSFLIVLIVICCVDNVYAVPSSSPSANPLSSIGVVYRDHVTAPITLFGFREDLILSQNGYTQLKMQSDGNLVLYHRDDNTTSFGGASWATHTHSGGYNCHLTLHNSGDLILYDANNMILWHSNHSNSKTGIAPFVLSVSDDGTASISDNTQTPVWRTSWMAIHEYITSPYTLYGQYSETIRSTNNLVELRIQPDGNLVLYNMDGGEHVLWAANTGSFIQLYTTVLHDSGDLVTYYQDNSVFWNSSSETGIAPFYLVVSNDFVAYIVDSNNAIVWTTEGSPSGPYPTRIFTLAPSNDPTKHPSTTPSLYPTNVPSIHPSMPPTNVPSIHPTNVPSIHPTNLPSMPPTNLPSMPPTNVPSIHPSFYPTNVPSIPPTNVPSISPSNVPSVPPSNVPSVPPTNVPSMPPTNVPSIHPTSVPSVPPTNVPTNDPTNVPSIHPTTSPTYTPSLNPSSMPSLYPTNAPSNHPAIVPTIHPTQSPSSVPSFTPTTTPSLHPTIAPSSIPTDTSLAPTLASAAPTSLSRMPSLIPTTFPSSNPSSIPSAAPTSMPFISPTLATLTPTTATPTTAPTISFSASAVWSSSFLSVFIDIDSHGIALDTSSLLNSCSAIFDAETLNQIGGNKAVCTWIHTENTAHSHDIAIQLPSTATLNLIHNTITIKPGAFDFQMTMEGTLYTLGTFITIQSIELPQVVSTPNIITNIQPMIGRCDDLILDARSTTNLGGRDNAYFDWFIYVLNTTKQGSFVTLSSAEISELINDITVRLTVTNWYDASSSLMVYISKSVLDFVPNIELSGITEYSQASDALLNGKIAIHSSIIFGNDCDNKPIELQSDQYSTEWLVQIDKQNQNDVIDADILHALKTYLTSQSGQTSITIDTTYHIQSGVIYIFMMHFACDHDVYACDVNATHVITYKYSDIVCKIMGGDIVLDGIRFEDLMSYNMQLNGGLFTYDPDQMSSSADHLQFDWTCIDHVNEDQTCIDLLDSTSASVVHADFDNIQQQNEYRYTFSVDVSDKDNVQRDHCSHSVQFNALILKEENVTNSPFCYVISTTAISNSINVYDKVRIVTNIINDHSDLYIDPTSHTWHEVNGLLSDTDIIQYSESTDTSLNLVLQSNVLTAGATYSFELEVFNHDHVLKAYGKSGPNSIYVLTGPRIIANSFKLSPECSDGTMTYDSIDDYMQEKHSFSVITDGDYPPLLYQFIYNDNHYLHPNLISAPYLMDIYLPIGAANNVFSVHVYDAASALVTDTLQCNIVFNSYSQCVDLDMFDAESFVTDNAKQLNTLQISYVYLQYMHVYDHGNNDECLTQTLSAILMQVNDHVQDLCQSNTVILLSQVLHLWMDLVASDESLIEFYYTEHASEMEELLFKALDPCFYLRNIIGFDQVQNELTVSLDSIVTNIVKIYHKNIDITSYLSRIETHDQYKHLLYAMTESVIVFIKTSSNHQIYELLSSALYIASLSTVSTSIPGEQIILEFDDFFVFTTRISNDNNVSITVQNISIYIPDDFLSDQHDENPNQNPFGDASDVVIVGIERNESSVNISFTDKNKQCQHDAILSKQSISITINGGNTTSSNASFIQFSFPCSGKCDHDYECTWHDPVHDIWLNDGCDTDIDHKANKIICTCSHLTTFATIHNINKQCSHLMNDWFDSDYFDYIHLTFAALYCLVAIYIILEIYPFFIDQYLTIKQRSIVVMLLILLVSILYFVICITFYILKLYDVNEHVLKTIVTVSLLVVQFVYLIIYSLIFYTWFSIAHAWKPNKNLCTANMKQIMYVFNVVIALFLVVACLYALVFSSSSDMAYFVIFEVAWSCVSLILSTVLVVYSFATTNVLLRSAKYSKSQEFGHKESQLVKKLVFINALIALFFVFSTVSTIYFTFNLNAFNLMYRGIDLLLNWMFVVVLCWMYRDAMKRTIVSEASKGYDFDKYYCFCSKHFVITDRLIQLSHVNSESVASPTGGRRGTTTNTTPSKPYADQSVTSKTGGGDRYTTTRRRVISISSKLDPIASSSSEEADGDVLDRTDFDLTITAPAVDASPQRPVSPRDKLMEYARSMSKVTVGGFGGAVSLGMTDWDSAKDEKPIK